MSCRYDWVISQGVFIEESKWLRVDEVTRLYDVGQSPVISTCSHRFRVVLEVEAIYQNLTQEIEFAKLAKHQALTN